MPSKQTIGQKIRTTEPPVASKSRHDNTQHSEQHYVCHRELAVCSVLVMSIYVKLLCTMKFLTSDMHGPVTVFLKLHEYTPLCTYQWYALHATPGA